MMMTINETYKACGFTNTKVLEVAETLVSLLSNPTIKNSDENEIIITVEKSKSVIIYIIDDCADIQKIKTKEGISDGYDVFYYEDGLDFTKIVKK